MTDRIISLNFRLAGRSTEKVYRKKRKQVIYGSKIILEISHTEKREPVTADDSHCYGIFWVHAAGRGVSCGEPGD